VTDSSPVDTRPGFWESVWLWLKRIWAWSATNLAAPGVALLIVAAAIVLLVIGVKNIQLGGILGWLLGKPDPGIKSVDVANKVDPARVDKDGNVIPIGTPDSQGDTQAKVVPIDPVGPFSNPDHVTFTDPATKEMVTVKLPDGVKLNNVDEVVVIKPNVVAVTVKDTSGVSPQTVDDLLKKYGG
jgi:hypothetical protein